MNFWSALATLEVKVVGIVEKLRLLYPYDRIINRMNRFLYRFFVDDEI